MPCCRATDSDGGDSALSQPLRHGSHGRNPWRYIRVIVLMLNALFIGAVFLLDPTLQSQIRQGNWYVRSYGVLALLTLVQYLYTANSSPGYLADMLRAGSGMHPTFINTATLSKKDRSIENGILNSAMIRGKRDPQSPQSAAPSLLLRMLDLYPPGSSSRDLTCSSCGLIQPPRTKHCHDCDKCVLQFDHHCTWLGTCVGRRNHCRFWWYIFEQAILAGWTVALYIQFLHLDMNESWLKGLTGLILLVPLIIIHIVLVILVMMHTYLALTNQTTYEIARRKRIPYLRGVPAKVYPFSQGICRNLYDLCL